jgi:hypothetical protein
VQGRVRPTSLRQIHFRIANPWRADSSRGRYHEAQDGPPCICDPDRLSTAGRRGHGAD